MKLTVEGASELIDALSWATDLTKECGGAACIERHFDKWVAMKACQNTGNQVVCVVGDDNLRTCIRCPMAPAEHKAKVMKKLDHIKLVKNSG